MVGFAWTWREKKKKKDTIRHIVLECGGISANPFERNIRLPEAKEFKCTTETVNYKDVEVTK